MHPGHRAAVRPPPPRALSADTPRRTHNAPAAYCFRRLRTCAKVPFLPELHFIIADRPYFLSSGTAADHAAAGRRRNRICDNDPSRPAAPEFSVRAGEPPATGREGAVARCRRGDPRSGGRGRDRREAGHPRGGRGSPVPGPARPAVRAGQRRRYRVLLRRSGGDRAARARRHHSAEGGERGRARHGRLAAGAAGTRAWPAAGRHRPDPDHRDGAGPRPARRDPRRRHAGSSG